MIEAVLLDMGGVLLAMGTSHGLPHDRLDWRGREALLTMLRQDGARLEEDDLEQLLFAPWRHDYAQRYALMHDAEWTPHLDRLRRQAGSQRDDLELLATWFEPYGESLAPAPYAAEVVTELSAAGFGLAVVSNVPLPGELYRRILARHDLAAPFERLLFSYDTGHRKPSPVMLHHALDKLGVAPDAAVMVGDRRATDVAAGRGAGVRTVWLRSIYTDGPLADVDLDHLGDLPSLIARWNAG